MSQVYSTEPQTSGRVVLQTTHGPIDISLWCKECPITTRRFLQCCLDGYYDDLIFHRILDKFLIQTGLRNETTCDDKDDDKNQKKDRPEVQSRIRFNHRGQVALAKTLITGDTVSNDNLTDQFFITLDEAPFLDGKNIIFGTVNGPTIFNAMRIGRSEIDPSSDGMPLIGDSYMPPKIISTQIDTHPFEDLVASRSVPWKVAANERQVEENATKKKRKRKGKKDLNVLSFGDEEKALEEEIEAAKKSRRHQKDGEVSTDNENLVKKLKMVNNTVDHEEDRDSKKRKKKLRKEDKAEHAKSGEEKCRNLNQCESTKSYSSNGKGEVFLADSNDDEKSSLSLIKGNHKVASIKPTITADGEKRYAKDSSSPGANSTSEITYKKVNTAIPIPAVQINKDAPVSLVSLSKVEARRTKYISMQRQKQELGGSLTKKKRAEDTMEKLFAFRSKLTLVKNNAGVQSTSKLDDSLAAKIARKQAAASSKGKHCQQEESGETYRGQLMEKGSYDSSDEDGGVKWMRSKFKCRKHVDYISKDSGSSIVGGDGRVADDYIVIDDKNKNIKNHQGKRHAYSTALKESNRKAFDRRRPHKSYKS